MGPVGGLEILVLLGLALLLGVALLVGVIIVVTRSKSSGNDSSPGEKKSSADRIRELDQLLAEKMISKDEYEERRKSILQEI